MMIDLALAILAAAALLALLPLLRNAIPKIELRGHSESHNGIKVREVALTWLRSARRGQSAGRRFECAVYVTLKRGS